MKPTRRNFAHLSQGERDAYVAAVQGLDADLVFPDGVSYWDKQDQIHQATHVHGGPAFVTWHRELLNRYEAMLQQVDPTVALHYWDWTVDPRNAPDGQGGTVDLMTAANMGSPTDRVGAPFDTFDNGGNLPGSREDTGDAADPPQEITRGLDPGSPPISDDATIIASGDASPMDQQWTTFRETLESNHNNVHGYIGGDIGVDHRAFEDPLVFLLHSNVDRLWAMWQTQPGYEWRLDSAQHYGVETTDPAITELMEPWAGATGLRPWAPPENQIESKSSLDPTVVQPPCYDTLSLSVELASPISGAPITFNAVPESVTTVRAAVFEIRSCTDITLEVIDGPGVGFDTPLGTTTEVAYSHEWPYQGRVWVSFTGTTAGSSNNGSITIRCIETGEEWEIPITAQTIARPKAAGMLVLDKSGSMAWDSGIPGASRLDVLKWAAPQYVNLMDDDDGLGIVAFDHDAYPAMAVTPAGPPVFGPGRAAALTAITGHQEDGGGTAIGDGLELAHNTINPVAGYDHKSLVVFTDGHETASKTISDVAGLLNERVFAIGLGRAEQLDVGTLSNLTSGSGGFLLMTGDLGVDDLFRVSKYFLQVLAGVTNTEIVVDPEGAIAPGQTHRIPFLLSEADYRTDVVLMSPAPWALEFAIETPEGKIITEAETAAIANASFITTNAASFYRVALPMLLDRNPVHGGTWHALLRVDEGNYKEYRGTVARSTNSGLRSGVPYNVSVYARSAVSLQAFVQQTSYEPGASIGLRATLSQYDLPISLGAQVRCVIDRPDGTSSTVALVPEGDGGYSTGFAAMAAGIYQLRFLATGKTLAGFGFSREAIRTVAVTPGGDRPPAPPLDDPWERICELVECLISDDRLAETLARIGIDRDTLKKCLQTVCGRRQGRTTDGPRLDNETANELSALLSRPDVRRVLLATDQT